MTRTWAKRWTDTHFPLQVEEVIEEQHTSLNNLDSTGPAGNRELLRTPDHDYRDNVTGIFCREDLRDRADDCGGSPQS